MQEVTTDGAPVYEDLPFSQAIVHGDTVYVSGQVPVDPETKEIVGEGVREQTHRTMRNVEAVLSAAGSSLDSIVKATVFLADVEDFEAFNEVYSEYVSSPEPARSAFEVGDLAIDVTVEIEVVGAVE